MNAYDNVAALAQRAAEVDNLREENRILSGSLKDAMGKVSALSVASSANHAQAMDQNRQLNEFLAAYDNYKAGSWFKAAGWAVGKKVVKVALTAATILAIAHGGAWLWKNVSVSVHTTEKAQVSASATSYY